MAFKTVPFDTVLKASFRCHKRGMLWWHSRGLFATVVIFVIMGKHWSSHSYCNCTQSKVQAHQLTHTASGQDFKPVRGGVRKGENRLYISCLAMDGQWNATQGDTLLCQQYPIREGRVPERCGMCWFSRTKTESRNRSVVPAATPQHDPTSNSWCALAAVEGADKPMMSFL